MITETIKLSLSSYFNGKRLSEMTEDERREVIAHFQDKGAREIIFY